MDHLSFQVAGLPSRLTPKRLLATTLSVPSPRTPIPKELDTTPGTNGQKRTGRPLVLPHPRHSMKVVKNLKARNLIIKNASHARSVRPRRFLFLVSFQPEVTSGKPTRFISVSPISGVWRVRPRVWAGAGSARPPTFVDMRRFGTDCALEDCHVARACASGFSASGG